MSENIRIKTTPNGGDNYITLKLEQDFDFIEILSLKISQEDVYRKFCSDYGVVAGRVIVNNGFGVPNAKVSIFIPLDDIDKEDPLIRGLYPYEFITDTDSEGIRYNLLPKYSETDNECYTPVGTFPSKREILDNDTTLKIYSKYYKYTTTTNDSGDYMIFGVPLGTYVIHVDADISDIGIISQRPYDLISQGTPKKLFDSSTKFKADKNLTKLIQVKTLDAGVNIQPFWGDTENCEIGISRVDFDLNYTVVPSAIFMGSIYGDQDKQSINKRCRPRRKLGSLCEQVTSAGFVNMIRKTTDNTIEEFDVEGGRVIDEDGTWAYQIPMNLDYMITAEDGSLILSQDPNKGIPTRSRVRFKISMDETGGEGRLRTRASYLVPNNPQTQDEIDYSFDETTKDSSFKDIYWNKIYSVTNFISRFQKNSNTDSRNITGIKNVDACAGDKTPFPYNRVDTDTNPLFFIICIIIKIVGFILLLINLIIIPIINVVIDVINFINNILSDIYSIICKISKVKIAGWYPFGFLSGACDKTFETKDHVGCISVECDESYYAPGCKSSKGLANAKDSENNLIEIDYRPEKPAGNSGLCGLDDCIASQMAIFLDMFKFDFYNDWVNGTLFSFLLKYKKKKKGKERFCDYECADFPNGTDGNEDGDADNDCRDALLLDTCFNGDKKDLQKEGRTTNTIIREGLIKKIGDEFYYAATTHDLSYKLFATDLINLGSVFKCDWQGIPKIQEFLIPSSYQVPDETPQYDETTGILESYGMVEISSSGSEIKGFFFSVNCLGLHTDYRQCLNIRHICEIGVDIDEAVDFITINPDAVIGVNDIDADGGKFFRDVFTSLNQPNETPYNFNLLTDTNFNIDNKSGDYNFATTADNGQDYVNFRGIANDNSYSQPKHSYYFYFGLLPGKTALEKMNERFFTTCIQKAENEFIIQTDVIAATTSTLGGVNISIFGGLGILNYTIVGTNSTSYGPTTGTYTAGSNTTVNIPNLPIGTYSIEVVDDFGNLITKSFVVNGPVPLYAYASKTKDSTTSASNDGEITITSVGGGSGSYQAQLETNAGAVVGTYSWQSFTIPKVFVGLPPDIINGYTLKVTDGLTTISITNILVSGPSQLITTSTQQNVSCYGNNDGEIILNITGGVNPKTINTTGPAGYTSNSAAMSSLNAGTYVSVITDSTSPPVTNTITTVITQPPQLRLLQPVLSEIQKQCNPNQYEIPIHIAASSGLPSGPVNIEYSIDSGLWVPLVLNYVDETTPIFISIDESTSPINDNIRIRIKKTESNITCYSDSILILPESIELPPTTLEIITNNLDDTFNRLQCTVGQFTMRFRLSHLTREPYDVSYTVNGGPVQTTSVSINPITISSNVVGGLAVVNVTVTDSKGCEVNRIFEISVPTEVLSATITTTGPDGNGDYTHTVAASGGVGAYIGSLYNVGVYTDTNQTIMTTIMDSAGCTITVTG